MAAYKLTYLNYKARGELVRFILAYAEVDYEDTRLAPEKWLEMRPSESIVMMHEFSLYIF